jgi:hypothetical protein
MAAVGRRATVRSPSRSQPTVAARGPATRRDRPQRHRPAGAGGSRTSSAAASAARSIATPSIATPWSSGAIAGRAVPCRAGVVPGSRLTY